MTKSQNTKNEQQKDLCITSEHMTEQWKKGELINGKKYYITFFDSEPFEATFRVAEAIIPFWKFEANGRQYCNENGYDCVKVLAPVPSYSEWQAKLEENSRLKKQINHVLRTQARQFVDNQKLQIKAEKAKDVVNIDTARQIKQLKELLKECKPYISHSATIRTIKNSAGYKKDMKLLTKIDEALR